MMAKIIWGAAQYFNRMQSWHTAQKFFEEEGHKLPDSVQEYIEVSLPILTWSIMISKLMRIPLALLYLKYPSVSRSFFLFELTINAQEAFIMFPDQLSHIMMVFTFMILNYILLTLFDFGKQLVAQVFYFALFIYAQTILYPEQSLATHLM